jgi:hypothetical protein
VQPEHRAAFGLQVHPGLPENNLQAGFLFPEGLCKPKTKAKNSWFCDTDLFSVS